MLSTAETRRTPLQRPAPGAAARLALFALCVLLMGNTVFSCSSNNGELLVGADSNGENDDNDAPVAQSFAIQVDEDVPTEGSLRASDSDGDELTFRIVSAPNLGEVDLLDTQTGAFTYTAVVPGVDSFAYVASDGRRDSNVATVTVEVGLAAALARVGDGINLFGR